MKRMKRIIALILAASLMSFSAGAIPASASEQAAASSYSVGVNTANPLEKATITCSSEDADHIANGEPTGPAKYLIDGDKKTRWAATSRGNEWIKFDFGEPTAIGSLIITWEAAYASDYSILVSQDGETYTPVIHETPGSKPEETPLVINQTCRYLKLTMDKPGSGYPYSIYEIEARDAGNIITSLDDATAETIVGTAPVLPEKVAATYSDGKRSDLKVTWNPVPAQNYSQAGTFEVIGAVSGTDIQAKCVVTVHPADESQYLRIAKKQVGGRVLVPSADYADEAAIAAAATEIAQKKITLGDTVANVSWVEDRYVLTLTNGGTSSTLDPFTVSLPTGRDASDRFELLEERIELARQIGDEGVILLKNENKTLPLTEDDQVAVFGRMQVDTIRGGLGAAYMDPAYEINVLDGMRNVGVNVDETLAEVYETWCNDPANKKEEVIYTSDRFFPEMPLTDEMVKDASERNNKAVVVIGRIVGENNDMQNNKGGWLLTDAETKMLQQVTQYFDQVTVVYNNGVVADMEFVENLGVEALLFMGYGGQEGGNYVGDILSGRVTPSGKLTETVAKSFDAYPADGFSGSTTQKYTEDIFTGYRYFETFDPDYETVRYPFGYGLSYADLAISDVTAKQAGTHIEVSATVTNTGDFYSGKEVVQVYYSAPQMGTGSALLGKPGKVLAAFGKTALLAPGESQELTLTFPIADMASYDDTGVTGHKNAWLLEAGDYNIFVGNSIRDAGAHKAYTYNQPNLRVIDEDLTQVETMLNERLLADGTHEKLEVIEVPGQISIKDDAVNKAEAENYKSAGAGVTETDGALNIPQGESVSYVLQLTKGGKYQFKLTYNNRGEAVRLNDVLSIFVGTGSSQVNIDDSIILESGDGLETAAIQVGFPTGDITFTLTGKADSDILWDSFTLERDNDADVVNDIPASGIGKVEGEDYVDASAGVRYEDFQDDGQGQPGSCLSNMRAGSRANYKLNVEETGIYHMVVHYAAVGETSLSSTAIFLINNITQAFADDISFKRTSTAGNTYYNFVDLDPLTVVLPSGMATLTLESQIAAFPNIDYITFEKVETPAAKAYTAARNLLTAAAEKITFEDVAENPELMGQFVSQLTVNELASLGSGHGNVAPNTNTGSIGNIPSLGIPGVQTADGPTGVRLSGTTDPIAWPATNVMASSWNEELCEDYGLAFGKDIKVYDINCILGPSINIQRNPLGGRNFEYYAEDPYLTGKLGAAVTRGIQSVGVATAVKHFAVNSTEFNRLASNSIVSSRAMREIYLKAFEIVIKEADPWSIMTSYNFVNGTKAAELEPMMNGIARGEWGYDGVFMTDWGNDSNIVREALASGDVKMPSGDSNALVTAVNNGILDRATLEAAAARLLNLALKTDSLRKVDPVDHLAVGKPATASHSESDEHRAAGAVDGIMTTRWATGSVNQSSQPWFQVDLGDVQDLGYLRISWEHAPKAYEIQVSDNGDTFNKVAAYTTTDASGGSNDAQEFDLSNVSGRYIKMQATELWDVWGASIYEFEVYDSSYVPPVEEEETYVVLTRNASVSGVSTGLKEGDKVTVTANDAPEGYHFTGWSTVGLTLTPEQRVSSELNFPMPANNVILTADFARNQKPDVPKDPQLLNVQWNPSQADVEIAGEADVLIDGNGIYGAKVVPGTKLTFTFTPANGPFASAKLNGEDIPFEADGFTYTYTMPNDKTVLRFTFTSVNKDVLETLLEKANEVTDEQLDKLVESVRKKFIAARDNAKTVYESDKATQNEVNEAWKELLDAMHYLSFEEGTKDELKYWLDYA
ncbi:discoidin domain-containing protein, partial [Clostridium sp. D33t1_170424_F3]|uniref:discoidin domain-containing protein n=1 Tax=Clostridium sp. D33t1_170424_F3 TaxID=2787099 RepID=UPI0018A9A862